MTIRYTVEIDTTPLERLRVHSKLIDGEVVLWGVQRPAPMHRGRSGKGSGVTTAFTLARVEFGPPGSAPTPGPPRPRRRRARRSLLSRLLRGFGRRRARPMPRPRKPPQPPTSPKGERPVLRWVAATRRTEMRDGFSAAAKRALGGRDPRPDLLVLADRLAADARQRIGDVGGVVTGQTRDSIEGRVVRRFGPEGGGPFTGR